MNEQKTNQLFVFKKTPGIDGGHPEFVLHKRVVLKDLEIFKQVCMNFHFKANCPNMDTIIFTKVDQIFELNYMTEDITTIHTFSTPFKRQPLFFTPNEDQTIFLIASPEDGKHLNLRTKRETDVNDSF